MLTVKVTKTAVDAEGKFIPGRLTTKIVEAIDVDVHVLRPGELYEVAGSGLHAIRGGLNDSFAFYIANQSKPRPEGFADEVEFWNSAYIENSAGKTTETVRF
jgi:hypothetical protein